ncbi:methyl-accepting chemotaxis protein [Criibacterium bergeronii]|uniref:Methyl-accepting chemotaxis protein n=2 Tax=Criibacterium bergeronii TaxID=1871336 RepID=A0A552VE16_9FIRM|nr:methyl-accepting chemotaxis protein [Criibacterium bergeronii]
MLYNSLINERKIIFAELKRILVLHKRWAMRFTGVSKNRKSFKSLMMLVMVLCVIVPMFVSATINYRLSLRANIYQYDKMTTSEILKVDGLIRTYFSSILNTSNSYSKNEILQNLDDSITTYIDKTANTSDGKVKMDIDKATGNEKKIWNYFKQIVDNNPDIFSLTVGVEKNGGIIMYPESDRTPGYDSRQRQWYKTGKNSAVDTSMTDVYISSNGKKSIEMVSRIYDKAGTFTGVMTGSVVLDTITDIIEHENIGNTGKIIVVDKNGIIVSDPIDKSRESKNIEALGIKQLNDINNISYENTIIVDGKIFRPVKSLSQDLGFTYIGVMDESEVYGEVNRNTVPVIVLTVITVIFSAILAMIFSKKLTSPILEVSHELELIGNGDFVYREFKNDSNEQTSEIHSMMNSILSMKTKLSDVIRNISEHSQNTAATAQQLTATAQSTSDSANEVEIAVNNIAQGATSQAEDTQSAAESINKSGNELKKMLSIIKTLENSVKLIDDKKNEGNTSIKELIEATNESSKYVQRISGIIMKTSNSAEEISKASEMIESISDRTNLLALNAAIEAARAGEAGRGFSVVAEEIRKLAEQSAGFTEEIRKVIEDLKTKSDAAVSEIDVVGEIVQRQIKKLEETSSKFGEIAKEVDNSKSIVRKLDDSSKNIENENDNVTKVVQNLSAIAQENAATTQEASASVDTQTQSISEISKASENLAQIAMDLQSEISKFVL